MQPSGNFRLTALFPAACQIAPPAPTTVASALRPLAADPGLPLPEAVAIRPLTGELALIQAVGVFPPIVDDPADYGAIAAASTLTALYAVGAEVACGAQFVAWPEDLPDELLEGIVAGAAATLAANDAPLAGLHVEVAAEPRYGLALTGTAAPRQLLGPGGARPGDRLYLTKPLGGGAVLCAAARAVASAEHLAEVVAALRRPERLAGRLAREIGVGAALQIGAAGLLGHAATMAARGGVRLRLATEAVPCFSGAQECAELGLVAAGIPRNRALARAVVGDIRPALNDLLHEPQISGGLLLSLPAARAAALEAAFASERAPLWPIGDVVAGAGVEVGE